MVVMVHSLHIPTLPCRSSVIWEEQKRLRRWKAISNELKNELEALYSKNAEKEGEVQIPNTDYTVSALPIIPTVWYATE